MSKNVMEMCNLNEIEMRMSQIDSEVKTMKKEQVELQEKVECYEEYIRNIQQIYLPQVEKSCYAIQQEINLKSLSILLRVHALYTHWRNTSFLGKGKLLVKLLLRPLGLKKKLYYEYESAYCRIDSQIKNMSNIVDTLNTEMFSTDNQDTKYVSSQKVDCEKSKELFHAEFPLISILLPVYNHAEFICDAIESVQRQTYTKWELIIVNDGSTDDLLERVEKYALDSRIKIYSQSNQRLPNTLTNLHQLAKGEFVTWTSADNVMEPEMLSELCENLLKYPECSMVFADVSIIDDNGNYMTNGYRDFNRDKDKPYILRLPHCTETLDAECDNFINACFMYRSKYANSLSGKYAADLEGLEDYDFWLRMQSFGPIRHIQNENPLYRYRVHKKTMSEDLLTNHLEQHSKRSQQLIEYSHLRNDYIKKGWDFSFDENYKEKSLIENLIGNFKYNKDDLKRVTFHEKFSKEALSDSGMHIVTTPYKYELYYSFKGDVSEKKAEVFRGIDIPIIARKARYTRINGLFWEYPVKYVNMPVVGCHINMNLIDVEKTIILLKKNSDLLFSFCTTQGNRNKEVEKKICCECDNAIFMGEKPLGEAVYLYASWDMMYVPPLINSTLEVMESIALAWNIGRWVAIEKNDFACETLPIVCQYNYDEEFLGIKSIDDISQLEEMLDSYIYSYSREGCIKELIKHMNGVGQDVFVQRPDFELKPKERVFPPEQLFTQKYVPNKLTKGYIAVMVDTLDKGGLEQVVALLVREFVKRTISVKVFCTQAGGSIAQELINEGIEVKIFNGKRDEFVKYLRANTPILINTHYTHNMLDIVSELNIPMVEVIHNMYLFFNENDWKREREREKLFTKMIAVSELVKGTYIYKNSSVKRDKISVIGNSANVDKIYGQSRNFIRSILGIPANSMVFINVSSIDGRKNQLGLITAFEHYYKKYNSDAYLIIVGNVLSQFYDEEIVRYINELSCKNHILKLSYHKDIADLYYASDAFIMPSYFEGWSIAATEALYCGLPIIHSKCGSAVELIDKGKNGLMISNPAGEISTLTTDELNKRMLDRVPGNTNELVHAMRCIEENKEVWAQKRSDIAASALMKYTVTSMIDRYLNCFDEVVSEMK